ncbi:HEAT repeat domain-containing protein [Bythopirellula goksoeyrii]|uniref:HEAT repeat domain-containing protein n=1 Tax=Bythopirellula goksoeyrii TaxID=1400387 RepID=UPI00143DBE52|nr:HEAT repeat domain-containing protein [Bythopirellula goksoeyrii]
MLRQIASLGDSALEALVVAAAAEQANVALQARQIIEEKLGTWKTTVEVDPSFDLSQPTRMLASTLATHIQKFGPLGQQWSGSLALELVVLADALPAKDAAHLLTDCDKILAQVPALGPRKRTLNQGKYAEPTRNLQVSTEGQPKPVLLNIPSERAISLKRRVPSSPADKSLPEKIEAKSTTTIKLAEEPFKSLSTTLELAQDLAYEKHPASPLVALDAPATIEQRTEDQTSSDSQRENSTTSLIDVPAPDEMQATIAALHKESTGALLKRLPSTDFYTAGAIRIVLRERGITDEELSVLDRLLSSDPADRLRLVGELKVLPARSARRWLQVLLGDKDAQVRLEALTALATTNDPHLVKFAREIAVHDQDSRVSELAARIMREAR